MTSAKLAEKKVQLDIRLATAKASGDIMTLMVATMDAMQFTLEGVIAGLVEHEMRIKALEAATGTE